ncbi:MAG: sigma-70 family RNA polymerase sigma factor [Pirellulales bacterium]|nr:sigma-70 family RNA polymerase sigma factor [Pirellulales bacterium]
MSNRTKSEEFMELVTLHQSRLYGYIFALVGDATDADDLFQQTVLILWRKFDQFEPGSDFARWAWSTAKFEVRNFQRTSRRRKVVFSDDLINQLIDETDSLPDTLGEMTRGDAMQICVDKLPDEDRDLLDLTYQKQTKVKEVAAQLGRSSQSICNSLRRIRTALFNCIERVLSGGDS